VADWQRELASFFQHKEQKQIETEQNLSEARAEVADFCRNVVVPALEDVKTELEKYDRDVRIGSGSEWARISVSHKGEMEFEYTLKVRVVPGRVFHYPETRFRDRSDGKTHRAEGFLRSGRRDYSIASITKEEIIHDLLAEYKSDAQR
jgi:choline/glycine/proline betaine transport protein